MRFDRPTARDITATFTALEARASQGREPAFVKYLRLGRKTVRLVSYAQEYWWHVHNQLEYVLQDDAPGYDCTLIIWQEKDFARLPHYLITADRTSGLYRQYRIDRMYGANRPLDYLGIFDERLLHSKPLLEVHAKGHMLTGWNPQSNTFYYADFDLSPEEFIKRGHIFVQVIARILKGPASNLAHGAVVGLNDTGVLLCGMGYRGKSTFSVQALLDGFEYVSDDYLILEQEGGQLLASPIYSIITLHPSMWQKLSPGVTARFVSNNARKDKYVFNIAGYHTNFRSQYPVKLCMFLNICHCKEPSIEPGYKGQGLDEFVYSSVMQTGETQDIATIYKLASFVNDLPFYRINLSPDLAKNTACLRRFLENLHAK
ncbi:MAG: hypothetical protein IJD16_08070 [Desulfovibrio sp.]|nr:hypothetical protein [Desulfovibrio sp.]